MTATLIAHSHTVTTLCLIAGFTFLLVVLRVAILNIYDDANIDDNETGLP